MADFFACKCEGTHRYWRGGLHEARTDGKRRLSFRHIAASSSDAPESYPRHFTGEAGKCKGGLIRDLMVSLLLHSVSSCFTRLRVSG